MTQTQPLKVIIVDKTGVLTVLAIKDFKLEELYRKCGFKKGEDFIKQIEWSVKYEGKKYFIEVFAKTEGRANSENKYDFPPPIDTTLFYGSCAILAYFKTDNDTKTYIDLTIPLWNKIYEKLFGGFEDLTSTAVEDEEEEDELANIPKEKKTKQGYLKDGFVVDSSDTEEVSGSSNEEDEDESTEDDEGDNEFCEEHGKDDCDIVIEDLGSELSEETYDSS